MSTYDRPASFDSLVFMPGETSEVASFASAQSIEKELESMVKTTAEIFGGDVRVVVEEDAEIAGDRYLLFEVKARGDVDEVVKKENEWHRRCARFGWESARFFRLGVDIG